ncbi:hypothetical protein ACLOJK_030348 [Asimina triloba]
MTKTVQVISTENIKPSSPTPPHLRTFNLSLLDQAVQHCYAPIIFYYSAGGTESMLRRLKTSLAQTLTRFYPLSGRIKENGLQVDCNDAGVEFTEARVRARLPDFLRRPCVDVVNQLSPSSLWRTRTGRSDVLLAIQVSRFECGGISIALCTSHKIADGASYATFFMAWAAATSRRVGGAQAVSPSFQASTLFPNPKGPPAEVKAVFTKDNIVCRRLVFEKPNLAALRSASRATRVEAVSALIWRTVMRMSNARESVATEWVSLRSRMSPPVPTHCFGNMAVPVTAVADIGECEGGDIDLQRYLEGKLREAMRIVDGNFIEELRRGPQKIKSVYEACKLDKYVDGAKNACHFTSWVGFPLYEADFGEGKPVWISIMCVPLKNSVMLLPTRSGDGIEAWVNMEDKDMEKFEQDPELLSFVSTHAAHSPQFSKL